MERDLVEALLANEALVALTGDDRFARTSLLDRAEHVLSQNQCRIVRVASPDGRPLDLRYVMDQVVGMGQNGAERVERFFDAIALPVATERRIVLIVDDGDLLTTDMLSYLALIGPTTVGQDLRLQIVFAGSAAMWDRLPRSGNLSVEQITARFVIEAALVPPAAAPPSSVLLPVVSLMPARPRAPPTEGHEILRQRLAQEQRRRDKRPRVTSWFAAKIAATAALIVIGIATVVLWVRLPELRAAVREFIAPDVAATANQTQTVTALVARGNRLLGTGDVISAQLVFAHAASAGSGPAATGLGKTYDPTFLAEIGASGISPDAAIATAWYQRAAALGDTEGTQRLSRMQASARK